MEEYLRVKSGMLLDRYEWNGGLSITPKEHKVREKAIREGKALEVTKFVVRFFKQIAEGIARPTLFIQISGDEWRICRGSVDSPDI